MEPDVNEALSREEMIQQFQRNGWTLKDESRGELTFAKTNPPEETNPLRRLFRSWGIEDVDTASNPCHV